ncbi:MAG: hypothetical protein CL666_01410 [Balneola sp.]|nr:hypothetical protein [Balneola sp.]|tara:strand:+ start:7753 stop:8196 length:444 start_codon:yes stop_codon:yes gene_type:complete
MQIINHKFVEFIPEQEDMKDGVIYVSLEYDTAVHNCICGCGEQVVTPISPTDWKVTYNGESISLHPSIGNWDFDCKSHYWIKKGEVIWAENWSEQKIIAGRKIDQQIKSYFYKQNVGENKERLFYRLKEFIIRILKRIRQYFINQKS